MLQDRDGSLVTVQTKAAGDSGHFNDVVQHTWKHDRQHYSMKRATGQPVICMPLLNSITLLRGGN
jgi:hypothetical protein